MRGNEADTSTDDAQGLLVSTKDLPTGRGHGLLTHLAACALHAGWPSISSEDHAVWAREIWDADGFSPSHGPSSCIRVGTGPETGSEMVLDAYYDSVRSSIIRLRQVSRLDRSYGVG